MCLQIRSKYALQERQQHQNPHWSTKRLVLLQSFDHAAGSKPNDRPPATFEAPKLEQSQAEQRAR